MTELPFSLIPFPDPNSPQITITGKITRESDLLNIRYSVEGATDSLLFPEASTQPSRKDDLWKATCFEFFLAVPNDPQYWEFNMSPSGDWNVYHMDAYRRVGFREETLIKRLPFSMRREAGYISLDVNVDLSPILRADQQIQVGITSIIQTKDIHETYWALAHPNPQADFHVRESFTIQL